MDALPTKMSLSGNRSEWSKEFDFAPGTVFLNHASFGPVTNRGRLAALSLMERWGRMTPGLDVDDETFALLVSSKQRFGRLIGANPERVAFAPNTSYGLNAALWGLKLRKGERILLPEPEFPALVYAVKRIGQHLELNVEPLPCPNGFLEIETLKRALGRKAAVLALSWVQYFNGYRYDLEEISSLCHANGCFVLADAIQGIGAVPLDVAQAKIDALACGAQKWLFGQTGSGFYYLAPDAVRPVEPLEAGWLGVDWGYRFHDLKDWNRPAFEDGRRWEIGTYPFFSIRFADAGLAILEECGKETVWERIRLRLDHLVQNLRGTGYEPAIIQDERHRSGILPLKGPRTRELHEHLRRRRIHTSFREGTIRVSPHFHNTDDDVNSLIQAIQEFRATA